METTSTSRVQVLTSDERVVQASRALPTASHEVSFSSDIQGFLRQASTSGCDIAVIDLTLNGFAACMEIKALPGGDSRRVLMLCEREHDRWLCLQAGADSVIIKPLPDTSSLVEAVQALTV